MKTRHIMLDTINDVKEFVGIVSRCEYEVDLISDRYTIDAKSIMGIFSLDLSKPIQMTYTENVLNRQRRKDGKPHLLLSAAGALTRPR